jgi:hypothetical protein
MRIKHRFTFSIDEFNKNILNILDEAKIKYKLGITIPLLTFEIFEDSVYWETINLIMKNANKSSLIDIVFNRDEYASASWYSVRSKWRKHYPQPEGDGLYIYETFDGDKYCAKCGSGLVQTDEFILKKTPKWGKRNFMMLYCIYDEFFVNDKTAKILEESNLSGFKLLLVKRHKSDKKLEDIKQIYITEKSEYGMTFKEGAVKKKIVCNKCGSTKYIMEGRFQKVINKKVLPDDIDILKTSEKFGDGLVCISSVLISKKFYDFLIESRLDKDLIIEPIIVR